MRIALIFFLILLWGGTLARVVVLRSEISDLKIQITSASINENKPKKIVHKGRKVTVTAYVATGKRTKSGTWPKVGRTCGVSHDMYERLKGKDIWIKGVGVRTVEDRTDERFSKRVDVFVKGKKVALDFGIKHGKRMVVL